MYINIMFEPYFLESLSGKRLQVVKYLPGTRPDRLEHNDARYK